MIMMILNMMVIMMMMNGSAMRGKQPITNMGGVVRFTLPTRILPADQLAVMWQRPDHEEYVAK